MALVVAEIGYRQWRHVDAPKGLRRRPNGVNVTDYDSADVATESQAGELPEKAKLDQNLVKSWVARYKIWTWPVGMPFSEQRGMNQHSPAETKIALFRSLFRGERPVKPETSLELCLAMPVSSFEGAVKMVCLCFVVRAADGVAGRRHASCHGEDGLSSLGSAVGMMRWVRASGIDAPGMARCGSQCEGMC